MSVKVAVRVRPFNQREIFLNSQCCVEMKQGKTRLHAHGSSEDISKREFTFDYSFWSHDSYKTQENGLMVPVTDKYWSQERVFNEVGLEIINNSWQGYNCCLFAYGQTGAGKSYSMIGFGANKGIVPLACEEIFNRIGRNTEKNKLFEVTVCMVEIYNEKVQDLLIPDSRQRPPGGLEIRESKKLGVYVDGVTKHTVHNFREIEKWMEQGSKNRSLASTLMNEYSSRAHTIISIEFIQRQELTKNQVTQKSSTIHLIDLAGSQRVAKTGLANSDRLKEAGNINKSLHHLGMVIEILAEKSAGKRKNEIVPYRSSCLTRILQNSLGGNSKTIMICAISPAYDNFDESLSTLRYADQVKKIKNHATINQSLTDKLIRELRQQNQRLKNMIKDLNDQSTISPTQQNLLTDALQQQRQVQKKISVNRKAMKSFAVQDEVFEDNLLTNISDIDLDKLEESDHEISTLVYMDIFKNTEPYLTNLSEDQLLSGKLQYNIEQELVVGRKNGTPTPQVILGAMGIEPNHAKIYRRMDKIFISTYSQTAGDFTYVNGQNVYQSTQIFHNDRIVFGTGCVFVLKTPQAIPRKPIADVDVTYENAITQLQSIDKNKSTAEEEELLGKLKLIQQEIEDEKSRMQSKIAEEQKRFNQEIARVKAQKEIENRQLQEELRRKEEEAARLLREKAELEEMKMASKRLQEELQRERLQKIELEKCLQQSLEIENSLREQRQKEIKQMERKQQERMEEIRRHQEAVQAKQRQRQFQQQRNQKIRQQEEIQRLKYDSRRKTEEQMQRHEDTLKLKMVSCQNQNILNERFLQLKKKKKQIEELRNLLIKKERAELQKKLVDLVPQIIELNLIAKEMKRQIEVTAKIDYEYFGYYQLTQILKHSTYKSRIRLRVMVENLEEGRVYFWTIETFKNRLYLAKDMLERYIQDPKNPALHDKDNDPFWDPKQYELIGQSYLGLEHLLFNLDYSNPSLKIIGDKTCKGQMAIRVYPTSPDGSENLSKQQQTSNQIQNPRSIFEKDMHFIIAIDTVRLDMDDVVEFYVEYDILQNNYKFVKYQTNKVTVPQTNYFRKHLFKQITQPTLMYIGGSQICFKVYALRKSHPIVRESLRLDYQPTSSDVQQLNSYISQAKSEVSTPPKNPKNQIYENPDVLNQIEKAYDSQEKERKRRETNLSEVKSSKTSRTSGSGKSSKESPSEKDKCTLF